MKISQLLGLYRQSRIIPAEDRELIQRENQEVPTIGKTALSWQKEIPQPDRCYLCDRGNGVVAAGFRLVYPQKDAVPLFLDWWECDACRGWFVYPVPAPEAIARYWAVTEWSDPMRENQIAAAKDALHDGLLAELSQWATPGPLLDFGCNFGQFMLRAKRVGWVPSGFEPNVDAAVCARAKGFEVHSGWSLEAAGFVPGSFNAITVIDVFCLVWDPIATLRDLYGLLKPGGVLAMRLTNKRFVLGIIRALSSEGAGRDAQISKVLLPQFHSIGIAQFRRVLAEVGFDRIRVFPNAITAPWSDLSWQTRIAYLGSYCLYVFSVGRVNLSPGILLFTRKGVR